MKPLLGLGLPLALALTLAGCSSSQEGAESPADASAPASPAAGAAWQAVDLSLCSAKAILPGTPAIMELPSDVEGKMFAADLEDRFFSVGCVNVAGGDPERVLDGAVEAMAKSTGGSVVSSNRIPGGRQLVLQLSDGEVTARIEARVLIVSGWMYLIQALPTEKIPAADLKAFFDGLEITAK